MNIVSQIFYLVVLFLFVINSAIGVNSSFSNGLFKISWESEEGKIYSLVNSTNLINDSFSTTLNDDIQATPPQNDYQVNTDNEVGFYRVNSNNLIGDLEGDFTIVQSWSQETNFARPVKVSVPNGNGPFPVVIHLHGFGGSGNLNAIGYLNNVIRIAPDGYQNCWNIGKEPSKAPDVDFIRQIIQHLKLHSNVDDSRITIIGSSNGGALVHRLMIELEDNTFHQGVGIVNNMITNMFDGSNFKYDSSSESMSYDEIIIPVTGRRMLTICGELDTTVPYYGGSGVWQNQFFPAQESVYIWAQHMGFSGSQIPDNNGVPYPGYNDLVKYSYLNGDIMHYKHVNKGHNAGAGPYVRDVIKEWIGY